MKRDCVFLVADLTMGEVIKGFLSRDASHLSLGCRALDFDPLQDVIVDESGHDPGVYNRAHLLLGPYVRTYERAVVVLDAAWEGSPGADAIAAGIAERMRPFWEDRFAVIVIYPELEVWIWQDSPHVAEAFRYRGPVGLRTWLAETGDWPDGHQKPPDPKAAVERVLRHTRTPRSAAVYRKIACRVSVKGCVDPAFLLLAETLRQWFPEESQF